LASDKFQVRALRFADAPEDRIADIEAETEWCSTFADLRTVLFESKDEIVIEKALAVGAVPLKKIDRRRRDEVGSRRAKTMD
jgi:hypothetical protein